MNEEEKKAIKIINIRTKRLIEELNVELTDEEPDEPRVAYLTQQIEANKTLLNLIEKQQKEIENYQILKDDIEGYRIAYVDTPEFEENYISKDKIKEKIEKIKEDEKFYRERDRMYEFDGKINILKELLGE